MARIPRKNNQIAGVGSTASFGRDLIRLVLLLIPPFRFNDYSSHRLMVRMEKGRSVGINHLFGLFFNHTRRRCSSSTCIYRIAKGNEEEEGERRFR